MKSTPLSLFLAVVLCSPAWADEMILATAESPDGRVGARFSVSPSHPQLADTILLTLRIDADRTIQVEVPVFGDMLGELRILETNERSFETGTDREAKQIVLKTVPQKPGLLPIWPIHIRYAGLQDQVSTLVIPESRINVSSTVSPENASLEKIPTAYKLIDVNNRRTVWLFVVFGALVVAGVVLFLLLYRRRGTTEDASPLTAMEIALKRLANLLEDRLHENDVKKFFVELTDIVRWYIEQVSNVHAPELTTEEFLRTISIHRSGLFSAEMRERLRVFLEAADRVKFAKFQPIREEINAGFRHAEEVVMGFEHENCGITK